MFSNFFVFLLLSCISLRFSLGQTTFGPKVDKTESKNGTGTNNSDPSPKLEISSNELELEETDQMTTTVDPMVDRTEAGKGAGSMSDKQKNVTIPEHFAKVPPPHDPNVTLGVFIDELKLNETQLTCNVTTWLYLQWKDSRILELFNMSLTSPPENDIKINSSQIWRPFVAMGYNAEYYTNTDSDIKFEDNVYLSLSKERFGRMRLYINNTKAVVVHSEEKTFQYFPGDTHSCELNLTLSTAKWRMGNFSLNVWKAATNDDLFAISYQEREFETHVNQSSWWVPKNSSISNNTFGVRIVFAREHGYSLIQTYLPSVFFLLVGLLSLLLPVDIAGERVAICTGILLTLTIFLNTARMEGPSVSYLRALDYWLVGCIGFVFMTLFLNIVILRMTAKKTVKTKKAIKRIVSANASLVLRLGGGAMATGNGNDIVEEGKAETESEKDPLRYARRLNKLSSIIFWAAFFIMNAAYFIIIHVHRSSIYNEPGWKPYVEPN